MKGNISIKRRVLFILPILLTAIWSIPAMAQISPGPLSSAHANLEGLSKCTQCHTLGAKVSNEKCLDCHTEIKLRIEQQIGYHSSSAVKTRECISCHSDHHGPDFQMIRFDKEQFNHNLTGYILTGAHAKADCRDCHKPGFIADKDLKNRKDTYLGLITDCINCHDDYHQGTLTSGCIKCHDNNSFKQAPAFNHNNAEFHLTGRHITVSCIECHRETTRNGKRIQEFTGIPFGQCIDCHKDPHKNRFGQNCMECHSTNSFKSVKVINGFDHSKTAYNLENKHTAVSCAACHQSSYTTPIKYDHCTDCHPDYHNGQLIKDGSVIDCISCHDTRGFNQFSYSIDRHNTTRFVLTGSHLAISCAACHWKNDTWQFTFGGSGCINCHENIHRGMISETYYPKSACIACHQTGGWDQIVFDHLKTGFELKGAHKNQTCRACHFTAGDQGNEIQRFAGLSPECTTCHKDIHHQQFAIDNKTDCLQCHTYDNWVIEPFNHDRTAFRLEGKHAFVSCSQCHKPIEDGTDHYILFKIKDTRCESCHL